MLLGVEWITFAFTGCSGTISANAAVNVDWGSLPDLGGTNLAAPVRHGPFQLVPEGWDGQVEREQDRVLEAPGFSRALETTDLNEARQLPYWRDPTLPQGWTFALAGSGNYTTWPIYGYCGYWRNDRGYLGVEICGEFLITHDLRDETPWQGGRGASSKCD